MKVLSVKRIPGPRQIVLLLDVSTSMRSTTTRLMPKQLAPFTRDLQSIAEKIDALGAEKVENIREKYGAGMGHRIVVSLEALLAGVGSSLAFGDAIVIISDGQYLRGVDGNDLQRIRGTLIPIR